MSDEIKVKWDGLRWSANNPPADLKTDVGYGIYDTVDNCWLGDDDGPVLYGDLMIARISAQVQGVRLGYAPNRLQHRLYDYRPVRLKDSVAAKMGSEEALVLLEEGLV